LNGSQRWPATTWRTLLELALTALDELESDAKWTFGGGTALALKLNHRISYDIDIFLEDAAHLKALSPNRNLASRQITDHWQEPGHYIKLERKEGEIDFIVAAQQSDYSPWIYKFKSRDILVEDPIEILAKKLKYRGSKFIPRDIFDLLAIHRFDPTAVKKAVAATPDGAARAIDRIRRISERYKATIVDEVNPTSAGAEILEIDPLEAAQILLNAMGD
jgi:hypothetical protein